MLVRLSRSEFRSRFRPDAKDLDYLNRRGLSAVLKHARDFVDNRLAAAEPVNDGKQTPWRGHPVFVAQHATATCCRSCLEKWHGIPRGLALTTEHKNYIGAVIAAWLTRFLDTQVEDPKTASLFD